MGAGAASQPRGAPEETSWRTLAVVTSTLDIHTLRPSSAVMDLTGTVWGPVPLSSGAKQPHPSNHGPVAHEHDGVH